MPAIRKDFTGQKFGLWVALVYSHYYRGRTFWLCRCECGVEKEVDIKSARNGTSKSCGCLNIPKLLGKEFGRLTPIKDLGFVDIGAQRKHVYLCKCSCGVEKAVYAGDLTSGNTKSCGCYRIEVAKDKNRLPDGVASFNFLRYKYRVSAKKRSLEFSLSKEEFSILTKSACKYCGVEPSQSVHNNNAPAPYVYNGVDRVDNKVGYTKENCVPCCYVCNLAKRSMSLEEFLAWIDRLVKFHTNLKVMPSASEGTNHVLHQVTV